MGGGSGGDSTGASGGQAAGLKGNSLGSGGPGPMSDVCEETAGRAILATDGKTLQRCLDWLNGKLTTGVNMVSGSGGWG